MDYLPSMASLSRLYLYLLSSRHLPATSPGGAATEKSRSFHLLALLRGCLLLVFHALFFLLLRFHSLYRVIVCHNFSPPPSILQAERPPPPPAAPPLGLSGDEGSTYAGRALSHLLTVVTRIPANSRKYELLRGLADRLLEENLLCGSAAAAAIGGAALAHAFSRTTRRLEAAAARLQVPGRRPDGSMEGILTGVRSRLRQWVDRPEEKAPAAAGAAAGDGDDGAEDAAEKLAAEALWLAEKMAACGAAGEAVAAWGAAAGLARASLSSSPRLQAALVRISAFLLRQDDSGEVGRMEVAAMWLPLLCRASPAAVGGGERAGVVAALEGIIAGLSWGQQEEMLSLWLHHFASSPHSDWPDLQPCYASWYAASRKLLLLHEETLQKGSTTPEGSRLLPADASST